LKARRRFCQLPRFYSHDSFVVVIANSENDNKAIVTVPDPSSYSYRVGFAQTNVERKREREIRESFDDEKESPKQYAGQYAGLLMHYLI